MKELNFETEVSTDGGLFFQKDVSWSDYRLEMPLNTTPIKFHRGENYLPGSKRDVADVYHDVSAADLVDYRNGKKQDFIDRILYDLRDSDPSAVQIVFLEFTETSEISQEDMRTLLEIQSQHADILTKPIQQKVTGAIQSDKDVSTGWDAEISPFRAYRRSVERFIETADEYNLPAMAVLAPIGFSRLQELVSTYIDRDVNLFAYDWRGKKPSIGTNHSDIKDLMTHLGRTGDARELVFYSLNHRSYHSTGEERFLPAEELALTGMGFDIIGGRFRPKAGGGSSELESLKVFNPNEFGYDDIPTEAPPGQYPVSSSLDLSQIATSGDSKNRELRKILNAEGLSSALRKLRASIRDGNERSFLEEKRGYTGNVESAMTSFARAYDDATGMDVA